MGEKIDKILEDYYQKQIDLLEVRKQLLLLLNNNSTENCNHLIEFAVYLTGHDRETIEQMYKDWKK